MLHWETVAPPSSEEIRDLPGGPLPPELAGVLVARGYATPEVIAGFLDPAAYHPALPHELPDLERAVSLLRAVVEQQGHILVWGDFDVDGQTATAMLVEALRQLGLKATFTIPDRQRESHGLHLRTLRPLLEGEQPDLLLVCDTGSAHTEAVAYAKAQGVPVIIADHHALPPELPPADALVNPLRLEDESHPLASLSGAGVTYLLLQALFTALGKPGHAQAFLDLVALGLVADVVPLVKDTRYLLQLGLRALRKTVRPGILALCHQQGLNPAVIGARDIGFSLAPLLNAFGRLGSADKGVELLLTRDRIQAQIMAQEADRLNRQRKMLTDQVTRSAEEMIERDSTLLDWEALVLFSPNWHSGIIGIAAARLADKYHKPVALLALDEDGNARGSVRSVAGYQISTALAELDDILAGYGGHALAGGLRAAAEHVPLLRRRLSDALANTYQPVAHTLEIAGEIDLGRLTVDFAYQVQRLAPFGEANPEPVFVVRDIEVVSVAKIGKQNQHRRITIQDREGRRQRVLWWNSASEPPLEGRFDLAYTVGLSHFHDPPELQIVLQAWRQIEQPAPDPTAVAEIVDLRGSDISAVDPILSSGERHAVWAEGYAERQSPGTPLSRLEEADVLIVLTAPPASQYLQEALQATRPQRVVLLAAPPPIGDLNAFVQTLAGLGETIRNHHQGQTTLSRLRERLAVTEKLVQTGLHYIAARRGFSLEIGARGKVTLDTESPGASTLNEEALLQTLRAQWDEMAAYRRYIQRVPLENLLE
ncbi:MAG: single-stranded-DNA-specific exonuclease RecJ [Chloroflexi bacterium]|nr:single-stranded-DNA-specific exonuclease RecJ [Chloroflexota bacterium]